MELQQASQIKLATYGTASGKLPHLYVNLTMHHF